MGEMILTLQDVAIICGLKIDAPLVGKLVAVQENLVFFWWTGKLGL